MSTNLIPLPSLSILDLLCPSSPRMGEQMSPFHSILSPNGQERADFFYNGDETYHCMYTNNQGEETWETNIPEDNMIEYCNCVIVDMMQL